MDDETKNGPHYQWRGMGGGRKLGLKNQINHTTKEKLFIFLFGNNRQLASRVCKQLAGRNKLEQTESGKLTT